MTVCAVAPEGPWGPVRDCLREHGEVVVTGTSAQWADPAGERTAARIRSGAVRRLAACAVAAATGCGPEEVEVGRAPGGRPYLRGIPGLELALSHTGTLLVVALSARGRIGADAERLTRRVYGTPLVGEATIAYERTALACLPAGERGTAMLRLWTLKEAYTKAVGVGLRLPLSAFGFACGPGEHDTVLLGPDGSPADPADRDRWRFATVELSEGYVLSWAVRLAQGQRAKFS